MNDNYKYKYFFKWSTGCDYCWWSSCTLFSISSSMEVVGGKVQYSLWIYSVLLVNLTNNIANHNTTHSLHLLFAVRVHTMQRTYCYRNSVCLSVGLRPSVRLSHAWIVTKLNNALRIFWYHTKGQSLCYSDTDNNWPVTPPSVWNLRSEWPTFFKSRRLTDFNRFSLITSQS